MERSVKEMYDFCHIHCAWCTDDTWKHVYLARLACGVPPWLHTVDKSSFFFHLFKFHCFVTFSITVICVHTCTQRINHSTIIFHFNFIHSVCRVLEKLSLRQTGLQLILLHFVTCSAREYAQIVANTGYKKSYIMAK